MFKLIANGTYPGTNLPTFRVFDAEEYDDVTVARPRVIGEVWAVSQHGHPSVPTGVRYQLSGSWEVSPVLPIGAYALAAEAMIASIA